MIETVGNLSLCGAVLAAALTLFACVASARMSSTGWLRCGRWLLVSVLALLTCSAVALLVALQTSDFQFAYVAEYSERALPASFKFAALWAGQAGSLLLWSWLLAALSVLAAVSWRKHHGPEHALAHATLALACGFFAALILFAANPFELVSGPTPIDGRGLNPQLQDLAMIIHPPLLFTGYAGFTIPFAMLIGVLIAGPRDNHWLSLIRRWVLFSWMFLGAGILMGAWWAYIELGWGGYWAWDPVENASLLPWLTSTALLHSIVVQQHRGMFRYWNASLISATFLLCIFGTYITRSGVIDSVHAFAESLIGAFFLAFLGICATASAALIFWRRRALQSDRPLDGLVSREGAFLAGNVLLVIMMLITMVGTIFPLISGLFGATGITVKPAFYNRVVAPMAILLVGLMALAPVLAFGAQAARKIAWNLRLPALAVFIVTGAVLLLITSNPWALLCVAVVTLGTAAVVVDFVRVFGARLRNTGESPLLCAARVIDRDHRRYGGQLAHLGVMILVIGVAGSSLFSRQSTHRVRPGETFTAGDYVMRYVSLDDIRASNFNAVQATLELAGGNRLASTLTPQVRFFDMWSDQPNTEVAVRSTWREDLYVSLAGWEADGHVAVIQVRINPLVLWIWVGGIVLVLGSLFCMLPRLLPHTQAVADAAPTRATMHPALPLAGPVAEATL